jgi:hypothetical protein
MSVKYWREYSVANNVRDVDIFFNVICLIDQLMSLVYLVLVACPTSVTQRSAFEPQFNEEVICRPHKNDQFVKCNGCFIVCVRARAETPVKI